MLNLNRVDLVIIDCVNPDKAVATLKICTEKINFANVKILTNHDLPDCKFELIKIAEINTIEQYSDFCLKLTKYFTNEYLLLVQNDGFIINPELWDDDFLNFDYIGAPWNSTCVPGHRIGNGGFSLRSKKFLEFSATFDSTSGVPEDNFLCIHNYQNALDYGILFPPLKLASLFAYEYHNPYAWTFNPKNHFGFHGKENVSIAKKFILNKNLGSI